MSYLQAYPSSLHHLSTLRAALCWIDGLFCSLGLLTCIMLATNVSLTAAVLACHVFLYVSNS